MLRGHCTGTLRDSELCGPRKGVAPSHCLTLPNPLGVSEKQRMAGGMGPVTPFKKILEHGLRF